MAREGHAVAADLASELAAARTDLPCAKRLLAEALGPVRRERAMRGARHRILIDTHGRQLNDDELDRMAALIERARKEDA